MNRKDECIAVANELTPYQDLRGFDLRGQMEGASLLLTISRTTLTIGGPLTSRFCGHQGSEEAEDVETFSQNKD
ncbi:hypothetical protein RB195_015955 [Necator americanus]|uniref:Uncharacterized protein n=1 Tax=Necator americanus TaxID=51031 RepID=A0ABR1E8U4_NECAM